MKAFPSILALTLACAALPCQAAPLRDPFARPPVQVAAPPADAADTAGTLTVLRAIMVDPGQSIANIGGHIVGVGDTVGPYRVLRIDERSVTLLRGKTKSVLEIDKTIDRAADRASDSEGSK